MTTSQPKRRITKAAATLGLAGALALAGLVLVPALLGFERYVIVSGSMTGAYDRGALVFDRAVPVESLRVGDVITYTPPRGVRASATEPLTHRIARIDRAPDGSRLYQTRGDANPTADPWRFTLPGARQARVEFSVPLVGYALLALKVQWVRILLIGLPALVVALAIVARIWRDAGDEVRRQRAGMADELAEAGT
jgi:signal peptidase I